MPRSAGGKQIARLEAKTAKAACKKIRSKRRVQENLILQREVCEICKSSLKDQKKTLPAFPLKGNRIVNIQPRPRGLLFVQNGGRRNHWPRLPKWLQKFVRISSRKRDELSSFCLNNGFRLQKTNRAARPANNLRKSQFSMCHVTKYSTIRGVFQQPWPGDSPTTILIEEKALGTRLVNKSYLGKSLQSVIDHASFCSCDGNPRIKQEIEQSVGKASKQ